MQGIVIKSTGSWYQVRLEDGKVLDCRVVGKLRLNDLPLTNPIAVGDEVSLEMENETGNGLIKGTSPQKLCRPPVPPPQTRTPSVSQQY
nr:hypothetical protein [Haliscomenobacter sp.]